MWRKWVCAEEDHKSNNNGRIGIERGEEDHPKRDNNEWIEIEKNGRKGVCAANDQNNRNSYEGKEIEKGNENEFVKKITITLVIIIYA